MGSQHCRVCGLERDAYGGLHWSCACHAQAATEHWPFGDGAEEDFDARVRPYIRPYEAEVPATDRADARPVVGELSDPTPGETTATLRLRIRSADTLRLLLHPSSGARDQGTPRSRGRHRRRATPVRTGPVLAGTAFVVALASASLTAYTLTGSPGENTAMGEWENPLPPGIVEATVPQAHTPEPSGAPSGPPADLPTSDEPSQPAQVTGARPSAKATPVQPPRSAPRKPPAPAPGVAAPVHRTLNRGDQGQEVRDVQIRLTLLGLRVTPTGVYDRSLTRAVAAFQRRNGITQDPAGVCGPKTRQLLESATRLAKPGRHAYRPRGTAPPFPTG